MEFLHFRKHRSSLNKTTKIISILTATAVVLVVIIRLNYPGPLYSPPYKTPSSAAAPTTTTTTTTTTPHLSNPPAQDIKIIDDHGKCDIFSGEWIPNPEAPYYTNTTCWAIHEHQNCIKYGRPDSDFLKWRWKPDGCDLPLFNPFQFLDIVRGKSLAFVGDSIGRNQMQSMICLLSRVEYPIDVSSSSNEQFKRWKYVNYNFTISYFWSPFLVRSEQRPDDGPTNTGLFNLYLDEFDELWTAHIHDFDYLILNAGHWFLRTAFYYEGRRLSGCRYCQLPTVPDLPTTFAYRRAFRTAFRALEGFAGVTFMRTFTPSHFEGGPWNAGGDCARRRPFRSNETVLDGLELDMYMTQLEEFRAAEEKGRKRMRVLDATPMMLLRPDGHPSRYGHWPDEKVVMYNDCVHWCLPGPIDSWADALLHMLKMEARIWHDEKKNIQ